MPTRTLGSAQHAARRDFDRWIKRVRWPIGRSYGGGGQVQLVFDAEPDLAELITGILAVGPGPVDPVVLKPRDDVPVAVIDSLACSPAVVHDQMKSIGLAGRLHGAAEPRDERAEMRGRCVRQLGQIEVVVLGDEQDVPGVDRVDVEKGHRIVGLEDLRRRDLPSDDPAEWTMRVVSVTGHGKDFFIPRVKRPRADRDRVRAGLP